MFWVCCSKKGLEVALGAGDKEGIVTKAGLHGLAGIWQPQQFWDSGTSELVMRQTRNKTRVNLSRSNSALWQVRHLQGTQIFRLLVASKCWTSAGLNSQLMGVQSWFHQGFTPWWWMAPPAHGARAVPSFLGDFSRWEKGFPAGRVHGELCYSLALHCRVLSGLRSEITAVSREMLNDKARDGDRDIAPQTHWLGFWKAKAWRHFIN